MSQYQIENAEITGINYLIQRGNGCTVAITWEGIGDESILAHWADGMVATATRAGKLECVDAGDDDCNELHIETEGKAAVKILQVQDGRPRVRIQVRFGWFYDGELFSNGPMTTAAREQLERLATSAGHRLAITVEG